MRHEMAMPGHALIGMKTMYGDWAGDIVIPENAKSADTIGRMGQVGSVTLYPEGELSWVYEAGVEKAVEAWKLNDAYRDLLEKYVVCYNATLIYGQLYDVRLEHIVSIVPQEALPTPDELGRCLRCKSSGAGNVLLGPDGYCPMCGMDLHGNHKALEQFTADEGDIDAFVRLPAEMEHMQRTGGKRISRRVTSFPGAKGKEFSQDVASDDELNDTMRGQR